MLYYAMLCYAMLCYAMLYYAVLCYAMLCYVMLCCTTLYYAMMVVRVPFGPQIWRRRGCLPEVIPKGGTGVRAAPLLAGGAKQIRAPAARRGAARTPVPPLGITSGKQPRLLQICGPNGTHTTSNIRCNPLHDYDVL